jgi:hypothetical protein
VAIGGIKQVGGRARGEILGDMEGLSRNCCAFMALHTPWLCE